jgi:hypothetical protein
MKGFENSEFVFLLFILKLREAGKECWQLLVNANLIQNLRLFQAISPYRHFFRLHVKQNIVANGRIQLVKHPWMVQGVLHLLIHEIQILIVFDYGNIP